MVFLLTPVFPKFRATFVVPTDAPCDDDGRFTNKAALAPSDGGWQLNGPGHTPPDENIVEARASDGEDSASEDGVDFVELGPLYSGVGN